MSGSADLGPNIEGSSTPPDQEDRSGRIVVLDAALERGIVDADAGRVTPAGEVRTRLVGKYEAMLSASTLLRGAMALAAD